MPSGFVKTRFCGGVCEYREQEVHGGETKCNSAGRLLDFHLSRCACTSCFSLCLGLFSWPGCFLKPCFQTALALEKQKISLLFKEKSIHKSVLDVFHCAISSFCLLIQTGKDVPHLSECLFCSIAGVERLPYPMHRRLMIPTHPPYIIC